MFCTKCGARVPDDSAFCPLCGNDVRGFSRQQPAQATQHMPRPTRVAAPKAPMPVPPQVHPVPRAKRHRGRVAAILIAIAALVFAGVGSTYYLGIWGHSNGQAQNGGTEDLPSFGSTEELNLAREQEILPSSSANAPLKDYFVRIADASTPDKRDIQVYAYPRLNVKDDQGFSLSDFGEDMPAGTYWLRLNKGKTEYALPPIVIGASDGSTSPEDAAEAHEPAGDPVAIVPPADGKKDDRSHRGKYASYLSIITKLQKQHGKGGVGTYDGANGHTAWGYGTFFARLVDFGDGDARLVVAYTKDDGADKQPVNSSYAIEVYAYDAKKDQAASVLATTGVSSDASLYITFPIVDDKMYLTESDTSSASANPRKTTYYGITEKGSFGPAKTIEQDGDQVIVDGKAADIAEATSERLIFTESSESYAVYRINAQTASDALGETSTTGDDLKQLFGPAGALACLDQTMDSLKRAAENTEAKDTKTIRNGSAANSSANESNQGGATGDSARKASNEAAHKAFEEVFRQYQQANATYNLGEFYDADSSQWPLVNQLYFTPDYEGSPRTYAYLDVDGDGVDELLFGIQAEYGTDDPDTVVVLDGFTYRDGQVVNFLRGGPRDVFFVCEGGTFREVSSGGWATGSLYVKKLANAQLATQEYMTYDLADSTGKSIRVTHGMGDGTPDADVIEQNTSEHSVSTPSYEAYSNKIKSGYPLRTDIDWGAL